VSLAVTERYGALATCCCSLSCGDALGWARPERGETLVDLGCGRGRDVIRAAGLVGPEGRAIGVDLTEAMLAEARRSLPPVIRNVSFLPSDLEKLDLVDDVADVVISNCTINHAPDKRAVYREIHRILKPGGRFVVSDVTAEAVPDEVRADPEAWAGCYGGAISERDYLEAIEQAGFEQIEILDRSSPYEKGGIMVRSLTVRGRSGHSGVHP
jgi:ubiquinone/menaquinone biosynthesis C-methylase UbiE